MSEGEQAVFLSGLVKMIRTLHEGGPIPTNRMCVTCVHVRPNVHEGPTPHHCACVDAPMAPSHLRLDCPEQVEAPEGAGPGGRGEDAPSRGVRAKPGGGRAEGSGRRR
jgi:hypothetical protein